jgi:phage terminase large subunit-like protein
MASAAVKKLTKSWVRIPSDLVAIEQGCYFDQDEADRVCGFIETFIHPSKGDWAAKPMQLQPWQRDYLSRLYGWKRPDGYRRFRETYLEIPKKQGKSTMFSAIGLLAIFEEPGAEVFVGAVNKKQAGIIFDECCAMVRSSPDLSRHLKVSAYNKTITFPKMNSKLVAMSADVEGQDGANATHVLLDETHRFKNRKLYDVMKYAGRARRQPLLINITTAGVDRNSLCWSLHKRATDILEGTVVDDIRFLPVIFAADPDKDDLDDPKVWRKANPSMGTLFSEAEFGEEYKEAKRLPGQLNNFLRLSFNIWTAQVTRWLDLALWDAGRVDPRPFAGRSCYAALDLSSVADLTSLSLVFDEGDDLEVASFFFVPEETAARRAEVDGVPYDQWIDRGHIIGTPGNSCDYEAIRKTLIDLADGGLVIKKVGLDPWNARQLANQLMDDGFDVVEVRQGYATLTGPSKELERRLLNGTIKHGENPVMRWCVGNVATETDAAGNIKPSKKKSTERIDGVASMVTGIGLWMAYGNESGPAISYVAI